MSLMTTPDGGQTTHVHSALGQPEGGRQHSSGQGPEGSGMHCIGCQCVARDGFNLQKIFLKIEQ